jgi:hypothetical protein
MRYLLLIYNNDATKAEFATPEGDAAIGAAHGALVDELSASGELVELNELDQADAKVVRVRDGAPLVTDGPYAETKEFVGGFYLIDVADDARAVDIAARLGEARTSLIEVRRVGT